MSVAVMSVPENSAHCEQAINAARRPRPGGEGVHLDLPAKTVTIRTGPQFRVDAARAAVGDTGNEVAAVTGQAR